MTFPLFTRLTKLIYIFKISIFPLTPTVYENDGRQPTQPLLCLVPGLCKLPCVYRHHPHPGAKVWPCSSQQQWLSSFHLLLWLRFERPGLQLSDQLLLRQDLHCRPKRQPYLYTLLLSLHHCHGRWDNPHIFSEERTGEKPYTSCSMFSTWLKYL